MKKSLDPDFPASLEPSPPKDSDGRVHITAEVQEAIQYVIDKTHKIKMENEARKEDVKAIAAKMGCKPAQVEHIVKLVIREQEKGGVIAEEEERLGMTREVLEKMGAVPRGEDSEE